MTDSDSANSLEEQALKRKERLKSLKQKAIQSESSSSNTDKATLPKPKFRSYKPQDDTLKEAAQPNAEPIAVEEEVKDLLEASNEKVVLEELDISSLAPRKPDWDLKRDVAKKLEKLERRTQKAIAELIWERLKEGQQSNIGAIVSMSEVRITDDE